MLNAALSQVLFNDGASCGQCYAIKCDATKSVWCKPGNTVTVTATNLCPPNYALPNGGWCGPPRPHFDMSQPAWENIGIYRGGIIPVVYQRYVATADMNLFICIINYIFLSASIVFFLYYMRKQCF